MNKPTVFILWDSSFIWGLLALRALRLMKVNCCLVRGKDIAQGALAGKPFTNNLLLVPGGNARQKLSSLQDGGKKAVLEWVDNGGNYLGFCGGAGLALADNLGICPLSREPFSSRLSHLLSGHVKASSPHGELSLPVWWPGRFAWKEGNQPEILAKYLKPEKDLFIADIPYEILPEKMERLATGEKIWPDGQLFPANQPLIIRGKSGKGTYILSYAHLETPGSGAANKWLADILQKFNPAPLSELPDWAIWKHREIPAAAPASSFHAAMNRANASLRDFHSLGEKLDFFFPRTGWLFGWRPGFPGMGINNLGACLDALSRLPPASPIPAGWQTESESFRTLLNQFITKGSECLWQIKFHNILSRFPPVTENGKSDNSNISAIFGNPMPGGGIVERLTRICEIWLFELQEWLFREDSIHDSHP